MEFRLDRCVSILERTPDVLSTLLSGLTPELINNNEGEKTWSPYDIIGHLIHGEKTDWIPRAIIIMSDEPNKIFEPFDRFAQFENSKGKDITSLLIEFRKLRRDNIEKLKEMNISKEKLNSWGIHPDFGKVTLGQLLATWMVHDLSHINQITRVMAKNYKEEVGPWINYISFLR